jgi:radical SAM-linked protein
VAQYICRYRKGEQVRWISHLDVKRTLERAMRRARLPLTLTQGHNPHPKLSLGPPLPLGATSDAEMVTVHLTEALDPDQLKQRLNSQSPPGLEVLTVWAVPSYRKKETLGEIDVAEYVVTVTGRVDAEALRAGVGRLLDRSEITVERGGERPERRVDIRPLLYHLEVMSTDTSGLVLRMRLGTGSRGGVRPQEIVHLLGLDAETQPVRYHRTALYAKSQGPARRRPGMAHAWTRKRDGRMRSSRP